MSHSEQTLTMDTYMRLTGKRELCSLSIVSNRTSASPNRKRRLRYDQKCVHIINRLLPWCDNTVEDHTGPPPVGIHLEGPILTHCLQAHSVRLPNNCPLTPIRVQLI